MTYERSLNANGRKEGLDRRSARIRAPVASGIEAIAEPRDRIRFTLAMGEPSRMTVYTGSLSARSTPASSITTLLA